MRDCAGRRRDGLAVVAAATLTVLLVGAPANAGQGEDRETTAGRPLPLGPASRQTQPVAPSLATRDFLFGRPRGWVAFRGSWLRPRAGGELFTFITDQLTVEKSDFSTPAMIGEVGFTITSRIQASGGVEFSRQTIGSEYRRFVDDRLDPINQQTTLTQTNVTGSVKIALLDRGRSISRLAFVPRSIAPYVGAGGGAFFYGLKQVGDFVDFATLRVFPDLFRSQGWTPSAHVFGGTDVRLWRQLFLDVEGRYVWAHGDLGSDFVGFDGIDLNGFRLSTGVSVVF
jgi:hypothetical protein